MASKLSRRKIAEYVAARVVDGKIPETVMQELAAYLVESRRTREAGLFARAIEEALLENGVAVVTVTAARPLDGELRSAISDHISATEVHLREVVDPSVLGGVRLQTADAAYDGTIVHKLHGLAAAKV